MVRNAIFYLLLLCLPLLDLIGQNAPNPSPASSSPLKSLAWHSMVLEGAPAAGEMTMTFTFTATNQSPNPITIQGTSVSCGCTKVVSETLPLKLVHKERTELSVQFDGRGRTGTVVKTILIETSVGPQLLMIKAHLPQKGQTPPNPERAKNQIEALANRQAVFQGKCATCHTTPSIGKSGSALYSVACGICHNAEHKASMVPDLATLKVPTSRAYWEHWVRNGKTNSLMPAFEKKQGGPLNESQITSLVDFLSSSKDFSSSTNSTEQTSAP
jgi:mono/diheme cytochrome c family protein